MLSELAAEAYVKHRYLYDHDLAITLRGNDLDQYRDLVKSSSESDDRIILDHIAKGGRWIMLCPNLAYYEFRIQRLGLHVNNFGENKSIVCIADHNKFYGLSPNDYKVIVTAPSLVSNPILQVIANKMNFEMILEYWN